VLILFAFSIRYFRRKNLMRSIIVITIFIQAITVAFCEYTNLITGYVNAVTTLCILEYYIYLSLVYQQQMQDTIVQKERDINRSNLLLLRNQIQPHFIYNSLSIIRSLAKRDSAGAVRCIDSFSEYLKAHIGAIQTDDLISFEQELQNVKTYLSLVQADYTRKVAVIYELNETDFKIPPLSLEPIIENAVSHGISKETGIISIRTERLDDNVQIIVADNGTAEKDPEPIMHNGIGLENTRKRLELHCGGTLEMENSQNGMTVTITVPIQKESI
jgi:LytS/YehU family sensor histidine kinase